MEYILVLLGVALAIQGSTSCQVFNQLVRQFVSAENRKLQQVSYEQTEAHSHVLCVSYCQADPQCHSVNYNIDNHQCELNNATRAQYPDDFIIDCGSVYFDAGAEIGDAGLKNGCYRDSSTSMTTEAPTQTTESRSKTSRSRSQGMRSHSGGRSSSHRRRR